MERLQQLVDSVREHADDDISQQCHDIIALLDGAGSEKQSLTEQVVSQGVLQSLYQHLTAAAADAGSKVKASQLLAELAKTESSREPCVKEGLVLPLLQLLESSDVEALTQACRALGNICFDNDSGREAVVGHDGVHKLINLLRSQLNTKEEGCGRLRTVACGFLLNLTNTHAPGMKLSGCKVEQPYNLSKAETKSPDGEDNLRMITLSLDIAKTVSQESIQELVVSLDVLDILKKYLCCYSNDENLVQMVLMCAGSLADSDFARERMLDCQLAETIAGLLGSEVVEDVQDSVLELLASLAENDQMKQQLASSDLSRHLLALLASVIPNKDEESITTQKLAADLIVLILTGDGSMETWYDKGEGSMYHEAVAWLSSPRQHLQIAGALAMGNFARSDTHCIKLVSEDIPEKLLALLDQEAGKDSLLEATPTLQHAALSALRNLAIPAVNKPKLLDYRTVERVLQHISTEFAAVQFKLLATFRMLVDGQELVVKTLACHESFLTKLVTWCSVEDHAGVKGEASRLAAWMIKHSKSSEVTRTVASCGVLPHIINMLSSEHVVMQNEAVMALSIIATVCADVINADIAREEFYPAVKVLLTDTTPATEILTNTLTLLKTTASSEELRRLMVIGEFPALIKTFHSHEDKNVKKTAKSLSDQLNKS